MLYNCGKFTVFDYFNEFVLRIFPQLQITGIMVRVVSLCKGLVAGIRLSPSLQ